MTMHDPAPKASTPDRVSNIRAVLAKMKASSEPVLTQGTTLSLLNNLDEAAGGITMFNKFGGNFRKG